MCCDGAGKKASGPGALTKQLVSQGLPDSGPTKSFAADLIAKLPRREDASRESAYKRDEREAAAAAARNRSYAVLADDDEEVTAGGRADVPSHAKASKEERREEKRRQRQLRRGRPAGDESDEDEAAVAARKRARELVDGGRAGGSERRWEREETEDEDPAVRAARLKDEERERDLQERQAFEDRLRRRDDDKTKRVAPAERTLTLEERMEEERRGKHATAEERESLLPELRKVSRQEYLKKREAAKLDELKDMIEDEKYLFDGVKLSEQERRDIEYRRKVYELATQQIRDIDSIMENRYRLPESYDDDMSKERQDKRFAVALERYKDTSEADDANPFKEQQEWEAHQTKMATVQFGARDKAPAGPTYEYVFEDQINFIKDEVMGGTAESSSDESSSDDDDEGGGKKVKVKKEKKSERELAQVSFEPLLCARRSRHRRGAGSPEDSGVSDSLASFVLDGGFSGGAKPVTQPGAPLVHHPIAHRGLARDRGARTAGASASDATWRRSMGPLRISSRRDTAGYFFASTSSAI